MLYNKFSLGLPGPVQRFMGSRLPRIEGFRASNFEERIIKSSLVRPQDCFVHDDWKRLVAEPEFLSNPTIYGVVWFVPSSSPA